MEQKTESKGSRTAESSHDMAQRKREGGESSTGKIKEAEEATSRVFVGFFLFPFKHFENVNASSQAHLQLEGRYEEPMKCLRYRRD